jgi:hypothetical protein
MVVAAMPKDGLCETYASLICRAGSTPDRGDLVIVLPDDDASLAEVAPYRDSRELLLSYEPYPPIPVLRRFVKRLHFSSPLFFPFEHGVQGTSPHRTLPERWLDASWQCGGKSIRLALSGSLKQFMDGGKRHSVEIVGQRKEFQPKHNVRSFFERSSVNEPNEPATP